LQYNKTIMIKYVTLLLIFCIRCTYCTAQLQPVNDIFPIYNSKQKDSVSRSVLAHYKFESVFINFHPPRIMDRLYSEFRDISPKREGRSSFGVFTYAITNQDSSMVICLTILDANNDIRTTKNPVLKDMKERLSKGRKIPEQWEASMKHAPGANNTPKYYDIEYLNKFNADNGGEYYTECYPVKGVYKFDKTFLLNKNDRGVVYIYFLYKEGKETEIKKMQEKLYQIISFQ